MRKSFVKIALLFLFIILIPLAGCHGKTGEKNEPSPSAHQHTFPSPIDSVAPLEVDQHTFQFIIGWLSERELLIYEWLDQQAVISSYHVTSGDRKKYLVLDEPVISANLSPSKTFLLIHTAPSPIEAELSIFQTTTQEKIAAIHIPSSEIYYEWNPFNERKIFVTAFYEDWTYTNYIYEWYTESLNEIQLSQPFATWMAEDILIILDWNWEEPSLSAPLVKVSPEGKETVLPGEEFFHFQGKRSVFIGIQATKENLTRGEMIVFDYHLNKQLSFSLPLLTNFSGWEIPFYEILPGPVLMLIEPNTGGEADIYDGGFRLIKRNLRTGEEEVVLEDIENGPLLCSPEGKLCLNGYQSQNIIYTDGKKLEPFLIFREGK